MTLHAPDQRAVTLAQAGHPADAAARRQPGPRRAFRSSFQQFGTAMTLHAPDQRAVTFAQAGHPADTAARRQPGARQAAGLGEPDVAVARRPRTAQHRHRRRRFPQPSRGAAAHRACGVRRSSSGGRLPWPSRGPVANVGGMTCTE